MNSLDEPEKLKVVTGEALAESWNRAGIRYVLINGLYGYPSGIGRDLDILVKPEEVPAIIATCEEIVEKFGWDSLLMRWSPYGTWQLYMLRKDTDRLCWLEIDPMLKDTMVLGAAYLLEEWGKSRQLRVDTYLGPFPVSKIGHYVKSQLRPILYGDLARFKEKYALEAVADPDIVRYLQNLLGASTADRFCRATQLGVEGVTGLGNGLKWAINSRFMLRHPLQAIRNVIWSRLVRPIKLYLLTAGLVLQVVGPDFESKGEILDEAQQYLNGCFEVQIKGDWLPPKGEGFAGTSGRTGWLRHWLRVLIGSAFVTGRYYTRDRFLPKSVIQFVLYQGGMANVTLDAARYGFRSAAGLRFLGMLIPRPVEIVFLPGSHDQIGAPDDRNGGATPAEQLDWWQRWAYTSKAQSIAMTGRSPAESGRNLAHAILQQMEARFAVSQSGKSRRLKAQYPVAGKPGA